MSVQLPRLISDGMVLQRGAEAALWGTADEPVTVTFLDKQYGATPDAEGRWTIVLRDLAPGGPFALTINEHALQDVYVGDVWLCGGQSNMQLPMRRVRYMYPEEIERPNAHIRQFLVPQRTDFHSPRDECGGSWAGASPETVEDFSAAGYFFAQRLHGRYGVPVGLILTAIGGTPIHAWMGREALRDFPDALAEAERCADDAHVARVQVEDAVRAESFFQGIDANDPGLDDRWYAPEYDDSAWEERPLLAPWEGTGSVWLRRTVEVPKALAGKPLTLFLGTMIDWDTVYVNGDIVGNTTYRYPPREYAVPPLPAGPCVIAVRAIAKDGGRFTPGKQYLLAGEDGAINLNGAWRFRRGGKGTQPVPETVFHYKPTGLYNGMIAPLRRFAVKGVLWYQGESDADRPARYAEKFAAMVRDWRGLWGRDLPFLFVELAHWDEAPHWHALRAEQWRCLEIPGTAMAAADDLGEHNDLHPQNKRDVGDRLARCAMRVAYGERLMASPFEVRGVAE